MPHSNAAPVASLLIVVALATVDPGVAVAAGKKGLTVLSARVEEMVKSVPPRPGRGCALSEADLERLEKLVLENESVRAFLENPEEESRKGPQGFGGFLDLSLQMKMRGGILAIGVAGSTALLTYRGKERILQNVQSVCNLVVELFRKCPESR